MTGILLGRRDLTSTTGHLSCKFHSISFEIDLTKATRVQRVRQDVAEMLGNHRDAYSFFLLGQFVYHARFFFGHD
jgi:hypothetical protein